MVRTINQVIETVPWWGGNAQLTNLSAIAPSLLNRRQSFSKNF